MVNKKQSKSGSSTAKKIAVKQTKNSQPSKSESNPSKDAVLLEDTFKLLETLNKKVIQVESAKKKLNQDIDKLSKKVESKEKSSNTSSPQDQSSLIDLLKKELLNEFQPLISKFNLKAIKVDMYKEIEKVLDIELEKLKSEISYKQTKTKREFTKRLSTLESRLVDALRTNEYLAEEVKNFEKNQVSKFSSEISERLDKAISSAYSKINRTLDKSNEDLDLVGKRITSFNRKINMFSKELEEVKAKVDKSLKTQDIDIGGIEAKISKLDRELKKTLKLFDSFKEKPSNIDRKEIDSIINPKLKLLGKDITNLQEKYHSIENALHKKLSVSFSKKFSESLEEMKSSIQKQRETEQEFLANKFNENVNSVESSVAQSLKQFEKEFTSLKKNLEKDMSKQINSKLSSKDINKTVSSFNSKFLEYEKKLESLSNSLVHMKGSLTSLSKNQGIDLTSIESKVLKLEKEFEGIKSLVERYEDDLYSNKKKEFSELEKNFKSVLSKADKKLTEVKTGKDEIENFVVDKYNSLVESINAFEDRVLAVEKFSEKKIEKELNSRLKSSLDEFSTQINSNQKSLSKDHSLKIDKFLKSLRVEFETLVNDFRRNEDKDLKKVFKDISNLKSKLDPLQNEIESLSNLKKELKFERDKEQEFLASKYNESLTTLESSVIENFKSFEENFNQLKTSIQKDLTQKVYTEVEEKSKKTNKEINVLGDKLSSYDKKFESLSNSLVHMKGELTSLSKNQGIDLSSVESKVLKLEKETQSIKSLVEKYEDDLYSRKKKELNELENKFETELSKQISSMSSRLSPVEKEITALKDLKSELKVARDKEQEFLAVKYNESVEKLEKDFSTELSKFVQEFDIVKSKFEEEHARQVVNYNNMTIKLSDVIKEYEGKLSEFVEKKFDFVKEEFNDKVKDTLVDLTNSFKEREENYFSRVEDIAKEKEDLVEELKMFKSELSENTKSFVESLHQEVEGLRFERQKFEEDEKKYLKQIENVSHAKEVSLTEVHDKLYKSLDSFLQEKQDKFNEHEDTFRQLFVEKITNLHEYFSSKLNKIESKFVDKTIKRVDTRIESVHKEFMLIEDKITSQQKELDLKIDQVEKHELSFFENIEAHRKKLEEKVEQRLTEADKHYNKRFLDYDGLFSTFKGVIVDEVESLIRDVEKLTSEKLTELENKSTKLNFLLKDSEKKIHEFKGIETFVESEMKDVRDSINDLRVKIDLMDFDQTQQGMNGMIKVMAEYEQQLEGLVLSLKKQGMDNQKIMSLLTTKGHPKLYVRLVLTDISQGQRNFM